MIHLIKHTNTHTHAHTRTHTHTRARTHTPHTTNTHTHILAHHTVFNVFNVLAFGVAITRMHGGRCDAHTHAFGVAPSHACMAFGVVLTRINTKIEIQMDT